MSHPHDDIEVDTDEIEAWYFYPYEDADEYTTENPLYAVVAVVDEFGEHMVYDRAGDGGAFHSADPLHTTSKPYPPSDAFKTALSLILAHSGETHDVSEFLAEMDPWEQHYLEVLVTGLNESPELLPVEVRAFVNEVLDEKLRLNIDEDAEGTEFSELVEEEQEQFLEEIVQEQ